jgi:uncharacterized protein (DUF1800 family)
MLMPAQTAALSRLTLGADDASRAAMNQMGLQAWLAEQLQPEPGDDAVVRQRLAETRLRLHVPAAGDAAAVDELRPLQWLDAPIDALWSLLDPARALSNPEKARPRNEVIAATLVRAVHSRWQVREVMVDFWHNHFNINARDQNTGVAFPVHDREVIRRHALGNFREMLGAVARSPAMLWYLNNRSSRAGAPNENYARELFELHTLGRDAYLNGLYNRWREVPGAERGQPAGYIDQDVYEAARAFTGWTVEDGAGLGGGRQLPRTGRYTYVEAWHDNYQKRVLATEFDPFQSPEADGNRVLDLAAFHPATARFLSRKLCVRLVADDPPESLLASTARVFIEQREQPDQIARVVRHIVLSREFAQTQGAKIKRPFELVVSVLRATGQPFTPTEGLVNEMDAAGQRLFGWPAPTGHPDTVADWSGANTMRRRWSLVAGLMENWWQTGVFDPWGALDGRRVSAEAFARFWVQRLHGRDRPDVVRAVLASAELAPSAPLDRPQIARRMVGWAAMDPEFQRR